MGNKNQTILTLNGRHYNALTGEMIDEVSHDAKTVKPISDFVASPAPLASKKAAPTPAPTPTNHKPVMDIARPAAQHLHPRKPQKAATLVRSAVSKPSPGLKRTTVAVSPIDASRNQLTTAVVQPKLSIAQLDPKRIARAQKVNKNQLIQKFAPFSPESTPLRAEAAVNIAPFDPDELKAHAEQAASPSKSIFEKAIEQADTHERPMHSLRKASRAARKKAKPVPHVKRSKPLRYRLATSVVAAVMLFVVAGAFGMQQRASITMRFARAEAGFQAALPGYRPTGYHADSFAYTSGNVGTTFANNTSGQKYTLNQQPTEWSNDQLLNNFVIANYRSYQILQSGDRIIYVYGNNNASWIVNGIWYQLTSNGSLSTSDVLNIAASV